MEGFGTFIGSDGDTYMGSWFANQKYGYNQKRSTQRPWCVLLGLMAVAMLVIGAKIPTTVSSRTRNRTTHYRFSMGLSILETKREKAKGKRGGQSMVLVR
ncbi:hypothetical protein HYC85_006543 [Camellia sinensis]|uniref:Uncharacterized protein n=1 Tax=Camellia sinensis TaxID=4442 RepID=A0A7J7HMJ6_CAMSI|nr:hypothetical protein HYC85_006543 [Camellia sinensis]